MKPLHVKISKFLSYVLRHNPGAIGLELDAGGWAEVDELIAGATRHGRRLSRRLIEEVVVTNDKQRFSFDASGTRIRANQGHSIPVDLGLQPRQPPERLYHGTARRFLESILQSGLDPRGRQHVHLSPDRQTAIKVGQRHGKPVVLVVAAEAMAEAGYRFFLSENDIWLVIKVPPEYLSVDED